METAEGIYDRLEQRAHRFPKEAWTSVGLETLIAPARPAREVVEGIIPVSPWTLNGPGAANKTTLALCMSIHMALGLNLWGQKIVGGGGPVAFVSTEDDLQEMEERVKRIILAMRLGPHQRRMLSDRLFLRDMTVAGHTSRLVEVDRAGNLRPTLLADYLIEKAIRAGLTHIMLDPAIHFTPGESHGNDGAAMTMREAKRISTQAGCGVGLIHHTGQEAFRQGTTDQYAGRGASAWADNARAVWTMHKLGANKTNGGSAFGPDERAAGIDPMAVADRRVSKITIPKYNYGKDWLVPLYVVRGAEDGYDLELVRGVAANRPISPEAQTQAAQVAADVFNARAEEAVLADICRRVDQRVIVTKRMLRDGAVLLDGKPLTREAVESAVDRLVLSDRLEDRPLPAELRRGSRQSSLHPVSAATRDVPPAVDQLPASG